MSEETMSEIKNMSKVAQGEVVQWRHDTMPWGVWRRGVAEIWDHEAQCWYVRDSDGFLVRVAPVEENILPSKDGLPISATEQIAALPDSAVGGEPAQLMESLTLCRNEVLRLKAEAAGLRHALSTQNTELRAKLASMEAADSEECARLRKLIKETTEIAIQRGREAEAARHEAARHERRAASWQGAAQDALSQMEEMINNARAHAPGRG
jgi:hypothetical protein